MHTEVVYLLFIFNLSILYFFFAESGAPIRYLFFHGSESPSGHCSKASCRRDVFPNALSIRVSPVDRYGGADL